MDPYLTSVIASLSRVVAAFFAGPILQKFPRRPVYLTCALIISFSHAVIATYTYLVTHRVGPELLDKLDWLPLTFVVIIYTAFSIGYGNIAHIFQV